MVAKLQLESKTEMQAMEDQRHTQSRAPVVRKMIERLLAELRRQIEQLDALIAAEVESDATMKAQSERLQQVRSIGQVTATTLLAQLPELGTLRSNEISASAGVAPLNGPKAAGVMLVVLKSRDLQSDYPPIPPTTFKFRILPRRTEWHAGS